MITFSRSIPVFLKRRLGEFSRSAIKFFDALYIQSPVVGLDVVGVGPEYPSCSLAIIEGADITTQCPNWSDTVVGFYVRGEG